MATPFTCTARVAGPWQPSISFTCGGGRRRTSRQAEWLVNAPDAILEQIVYVYDSCSIRRH